jgi:hypothetical protein
VYINPANQEQASHQRPYAPMLGEYCKFDSKALRRCHDLLRKYLTMARMFTSLSRDVLYRLQCRPIVSSELRRIRAGPSSFTRAVISAPVRSPARRLR